MAEQGAAGRRAVLRALVTLTALVALAAGVAAVAALLVGRALTDALPVDVGAYRGVVVAQDVAASVEALDGVDSVSVETVGGDTFVSALGLVVVRTRDEDAVGQLAAALGAEADGWSAARPVHIAVVTPTAFIAISPDAADNRARIDIAARAREAGAAQVHVAPDHFDFPQWKSQRPDSPSLVTVVPGPGADRQALQDTLVESFGPVVQIADQVRWVSAVDE